MIDHMPERHRISESLRNLAWSECCDDLTAEDGDILLVAVPVCRNSQLPSAGWLYQYYVVTVSCDEHFFNLLLDGEYWGWETTDIDYFVRIK